jgi:hypothetical protein
MVSTERGTPSPDAEPAVSAYPFERGQPRNAPEHPRPLPPYRSYLRPHRRSPSVAQAEAAGLL